MSIDSLHEAFYDEALSLLKQNMSDEESANKKLTQLSKQVNATANV
jgi:ferritin-like metal-binding protein YciE